MSLKTAHVLGLALLLWAVAGCAAASPDAPSGRETAIGDVRSDAAHTFTLRFPADFTVTTDPDELARHGYFPLADKTMRLGGWYSGPDTAGTNLGSATIVVETRPALDRENDCARFGGDVLCGAEQGIRDVTIHGIRFRYAVLSDAAMGHLLETREYWTIHAGRRYEIRLSLTSTDIGMYDPGQKRAFDSTACWKRLTDILDTFTFSAPAAD